MIKHPLVIVREKLGSVRLDLDLGLEPSASC